MVHDQSFWFICAAFYLVDNARLHRGRELILVETLHSKWGLLLPLHRYRLAGRAVTLLPPWFPFLAAIRLGWLKDDAFSPVALRRTKRLLRFYQRCLAPFRALSGVYFLMLFIVGPITTHHFGLGYALTLALPLHIGGLALLAVLLIAGRRAWRMGWRQIVGLIFECAVCPAYFVNICRKLSLGYVHVPCDAVALALDQKQPYALAPMGAGEIELLLEDMVERDELRYEDRASIAAYHAHLAETRS